MFDLTLMNCIIKLIKFLHIDMNVPLFLGYFHYQSSYDYTKILVVTLMC